MSKIPFNLFLIIIFLGLFITGCDDTTTNIDDEIIPDSNVSYAKHIQPIFNAKCVNCHGVGVTEAGLDLTSWSGTVADPNVVFPGEPDNSRLIWAIEFNPVISPMPPPASPYQALTQNQIKGVRAWIAEGALNN
jgi:mono/diheme cytochrome c family protein